MSSGKVVQPSHQEDSGLAETSEEESLTTDDEVMLGLSGSLFTYYICEG